MPNADTPFKNRPTIAPTMIRFILSLVLTSTIASIALADQAIEAIADEPALLCERFPEGNVADAWLAAYAEHLAGKIGVRAPEWAFLPGRIAAEPIFDEGGDNGKLRKLALENAPLAFKRRNIFTPSVDLPVSLRAGRPSKSIEEKQRSNAERQRRFREARLNELTMLRKLVRRQAKKLKAIT